MKTITLCLSFIFLGLLPLATQAQNQEHPLQTVKATLSQNFSTLYFQASRPNHQLSQPFASALFKQAISQSEFPNVPILDRQDSHVFVYLEEIGRIKKLNETFFSGLKEIMSSAEDHPLEDSLPPHATDHFINFEETLQKLIQPIVSQSEHNPEIITKSTDDLVGAISVIKNRASNKRISILNLKHRLLAVSVAHEIQNLANIVLNELNNDSINWTNPDSEMMANILKAGIEAIRRIPVGTGTFLSRDYQLAIAGISLAVCSSLEKIEVN